MRKPNLRIVEPDGLDITALNRADIEKRDWAPVHVAGDRGAALFLSDRPRRWWRG